MRKVFTLLLVFLMSGVVWGQGTESFTNSTATGTYGDGSFVGDSGVTWNFYHSRNESTYPIDEEGLMLRRASDSYLEATIPGGIGTFSFEYRKAFTGTDTRQLELLINDVQVAVSPEFGTIEPDPTVYTMTVNNINVEGDVVVKIKNIGTTTTNRQTVLDNISWTGYDIVATEYRFVNVPANVTTNVGFSLTVNATDGDGNIDTENESQVTLSKASGPGNLSSASGLVQTLVNGTFTWNDLQFDLDGLYTIAVSGELTGATTGNITSAYMTDLVISEYVEGSSFNKYIEIGNWTGSPINLLNYDLAHYNNGSPTVTYTLDLSAQGEIAHGEVFVIGHSNGTIYVPDFSTNSQMMNFNGDDAIALRKNTTNIDVIGTIGDPSIFAQNVTLRRKADIQPTTTYDANNFTIHPEDDISGLGDIAPLPVELTTFTANVFDGKVNLRWATATEVDNYGFEVQRSAFSNQRTANWETIGFVEGHGNSNSPKEYTFTDEITAPGKYSYRLKQIDTDGSFEYSNTVTVNAGEIIPEKFELSQNYPNPFNPVTKIQYSIPAVIASEAKQSVNATLKVYDIIGREVAVLVNESKEAGVYEVEFDATKLSSGLYFYSLSAAGKTITKKMMLLR